MSKLPFFAKTPEMASVAMVLRKALSSALGIDLFKKQPPRFGLDPSGKNVLVPSTAVKGFAPVSRRDINNLIAHAAKGGLDSETYNILAKYIQSGKGVMAYNPSEYSLPSRPTRYPREVKDLIGALQAKSVFTGAPGKPGGVAGIERFLSDKSPLRYVAPFVGNQALLETMEENPWIHSTAQQAATRAGAGPGDFPSAVTREMAKMLIPAALFRQFMGGARKAPNPQDMFNAMV